MADQSVASATSRILGAICIALVFGLLVAGLWPFNFFPINDVHWMKDEDGLRFGKQPGTVYSSGYFQKQEPAASAFCSIEIWLQPARTYVHSSVTVLAFYNPQSTMQFRLLQYRDDLFARRDHKNREGPSDASEIDIVHAFHNNQQTFITLTSDAKSTSFYVNGAFVDLSRHFEFTCEDLSGQLVIGNSPAFYDPWRGKLLGLAIYGQHLTSDQVSRHYQTWLRNTEAKALENDHPLALYLLAERSGNIARNSARFGPDLYIPERFRILDKRILMPPWNEFQFDYAYAKDIFINVAGFVPFGFFFCVYLKNRWPSNRIVLITVLAGAIISLTIEISQRFIPSRSSGMTDIITNTLGTLFGAILARGSSFEVWATRVLRSLKDSIQSLAKV